MLTISKEGLALIKESESFVDHLYNDAAGHCTIGYGTLVHLGPICGDPSESVYAGGITEPEAYRLLEAEVGVVEAKMRRLIKVPLDQSEWDALVDFAYNLGVGQDGLAGSTLLKKLNAGDYDGAAGEFHRWVFADHKKLSGLAVRRATEKALFDRDLPRVLVT